MPSNSAERGAALRALSWAVVLLLAGGLVFLGHSPHTDGAAQGRVRQYEALGSRPPARSTGTDHGHVEAACRAVRWSCRPPPGMNASAAASVREKLNDNIGAWHFGLDVGTRWPSLNYSTAMVRSNWQCSKDSARVHQYQHALWLPEHCTSLADMELVRNVSALRGQPLDFLPPNVTMVSVGNSYLSQMVYSLVIRAWRMGQVESICDVDPSLFDLSLDELDALPLSFSPLCLDDSPALGDHWDISTKCADRIVTFKNAARMYVAYNSVVEFLDADVMLKLGALFVGRRSIAEVDVVLFNTGNSLGDMVRIASPCNSSEAADPGGSRPCGALTARLDGLPASADLKWIPTLNVSNIMEVLSTAGGPDDEQLVLVSPLNVQGYDYGEKIRERFPNNYFHFGGIFGSKAETCQSDVEACSRGYRHQCMPGPPDSMSDALSHVVWEDFCRARQF